MPAACCLPASCQPGHASMCSTGAPLPSTILRQATAGGCVPLQEAAREMTRADAKKNDGQVRPGQREGAERCCLRCCTAQH